MTRVLIVGLLLLVAVVTGAAAAMDPTAIAHRLDAVASIVGNANARLDASSAILTSPPPDPDRPALQAALDQVVIQANETLRLAAEIQAKLR